MTKSSGVPPGGTPGAMLLSRLREVRYTAPHLTEICEEFSRAFGGTGKLADLIYSEIQFLPAGSPGRQRLLGMVMALITNNTKLCGSPFDDLGELDDMELSSSIAAMQTDIESKNGTEAANPEESPTA